MATTTPNYGWPVPTSTDYVKDGATAIEALGDAIDATVFGLPSGGLTYITGASFTTATSVSLPNDTFTSAYRNYKMILTISAVTADADFTVRLRTAGTDNSTSNYNTMLSGIKNTGSSDSIFSNALTSFKAGESDNVAVFYAWNFDILQPQVAANTFLQGGIILVNKADTFTLGVDGWCNFKTTTQFDSLSFISSVASSITGTYRVYGYSES
jgi:hypothetical protein